MRRTRVMMAGVVLVSALLAGRAPAVSILFGGDFFPTAAGEGIPNGAVVQLVVSTTDGEFAAPTPGSFVGGPGSDDVILATTVADDFGGLFNRGLASGFLSNRNFDAVFGAGDPLLLRWWPTLTEADVRPGAEVPYGQYRPALDDRVTLGSNHGFVTPADNAANIEVRLNLAADGNVAPAGGDVLLEEITFATTPIPEPGVWVMLVVGLSGWLFGRRRRVVPGWV